MLLESSGTFERGSTRAPHVFSHSGLWAGIRAWGILEELFGRSVGTLSAKGTRIPSLLLLLQRLVVSWDSLLQGPLFLAPWNSLFHLLTLRSSQCHILSVPWEPLNPQIPCASPPDPGQAALQINTEAQHGIWLPLLQLCISSMRTGTSFSVHICMSSASTTGSGTQDTFS